jgi:hypothetical protein
MASKSISHYFAHGLSSIIFFFKNFIYVTVSPYKTMRKISQERDYGQLIVIFALAIGYFLYAQIVRKRTFHPLIVSTSALLSIFMFCVTFALVTYFFYFLYKGVHKKTEVEYRSFIFTFAYSLIPTFIWFYTTSTLFYVLPPPRTASILGKGFSLAFVSFSLTLLLWRVILLYLSVRFSTKASFYRIMISITLFAVWFIPYSYAMYKLSIFRIPFI